MNDGSVWDTPYELDGPAGSQDRYPLVEHVLPVLDADDCPDAGTTGDIFEFNVTVSDNIGVDEVLVNWSHGALDGNLSLSLISGHWLGTINLDDDLGQLAYYIWFNDTSNNVVVSSVRTVDVNDNDIPALLSDDSPDTGTTGDQYGFNFTISDNVEIDEAWVNWSHGGLGGNLSLSLIAGHWLGTVTLDGFLGDLTYSIWFDDTSGNARRSDIRTVAVTDNDAPQLLGDESPVSGTTGDPFIFNITVTDNIGVSAVRVNWSHGGNGDNLSLEVSGGWWTGQIELGDSVASLVYRIFLLDDEGNLWAGNTMTTEVYDNDFPVSVAENITVDQHQEVMFNGSRFTDNIGIANYSWAFDYGSRIHALYGERCTFVFHEAGTFEVELNIADAAGNRANETFTVTVRDITPPTVSAGMNLTVEADEEVVIAANSTDNVGIANYTWTFMLGGEEFTIYGDTFRYAFHGPGTYEIILTVEDASGNRANDTVIVTVTGSKSEVEELWLGEFLWKDGRPMVNASLILESRTRTAYTASTDEQGVAAFDEPVLLGSYGWTLSGEWTDESWTILEGSIDIDMNTPSGSTWWPGDNGDIRSPATEEEFKRLRDIDQKVPENPPKTMEESFLANVARMVYVGDEVVAVKVVVVGNDTVTVDLGGAKGVELALGDEKMVDIDGDGKDDIAVTYKGTDEKGYPAIEFADMEVSTDKQGESEEDDYTVIIVAGVVGAIVALAIGIFVTRRKRELPSGEGGGEVEGEDSDEEDGDGEELEKEAPDEFGPHLGDEDSVAEGSMGELEDGDGIVAEDEADKGDKEDHEDATDDVELWDDAYFESAGTREGIVDMLPQLSLEKAPSSIGEMIPGYIITHKLGAGGFATVYKAVNKEGKEVAIKLPKFLDETVDISVLQKFKAEADIWRKLRHRSIVEFYDSDIRPIPYMSIELMEGGNLAGLLKKRRLSVEEAKSLIVQVVDAISYAHRMASVHRDLKPENILFTSDGIPKISDWGIGKFMASDSVSKTVGTKGTFAYAAPEQFSRNRFGEIDWSTDIFQMGIVFYEMLTGQNPFFHEDPVMIMANITSEPVDPPSAVNPAVPPEMDDLVMKCLEKHKEDRWRADVMLHELKQMEQRRRNNLAKYRRSLERALADGRISPDEEVMLTELREHMSISRCDHDILMN